jgi:hypothetical protein
MQNFLMPDRIAASLLLWAFALGAWAQGAKPVNLALGSVSSSSNVYAFSVALANTVRKHDPGVNVTTVEGGGAFDHARLIKQGVLDWSVSGGPAVVAAVREGSGNFKKEGAWEPARLMFMRNVSISRLYVRADVAKKENIRTWSDLSGKRFSPGIPGTRDMARAMEANQLLGTKINMIPGSFEDAIRRIKEGGLVGVLKGSPHDRFDSGMLEAHHGTPLTVIGYRIAKAVVKGWKEIGEAFPPAQGISPIEDAFKQTPEVKEVLFHAGVIQMAKELGIAVPQRLVPPEYKDLR